MVFGELGVGSPGAQGEREGGEEVLRLGGVSDAVNSGDLEGRGRCLVENSARRTGSDWSSVDAR